MLYPITINEKHEEDNDLIPIINEKKEIIGFEKKEIIHKKGLLHKAVSIFIFNMKNHLMLQKRSEKKNHSSLLWTNTCCSHPIKNEPVINAAHRCLINEMGFDCFLEQKFCFIYNNSFNNGLIENELDYVFVGYYNKFPIINSEEVNNWKWISWDSLIKSIKSHPNIYTVWLKIIIKNHFKKLFK
ncbi:isopentenyl-diphosphate Delta-isomerase [Blattabacterium cuenoti]|uniref:isopentenyl-diphosphate Delta-isomerase n=1 Tax=Blattabacterium cuenoti TaxID=1653831 RepID=UPI00163D1AFB|nr:isopentenyl-diphosphate Delta-isomerase [Blattabacterium cuenoti]